MKMNKESITNFISTIIFLSSVWGFFIFLIDIGLIPRDLVEIEKNIYFQSYLLGCSSGFIYSCLLKTIFNLAFFHKGKKLFFRDGKNPLGFIKDALIILMMLFFTPIMIVYFQGNDINEQLINFGFNYQFNIDNFRINHVNKAVFSIGLFLGGLLDKYNDIIHDEINRNE